MTEVSTGISIRSGHTSSSATVTKTLSSQNEGRGTDESNNANITGVDEKICLFTKCMTEELMVQVAEYLTAQDLLQYQCTCKEIWRVIGNGTGHEDQLWENLCRKRWESWPRYRLTKERQNSIIPQQCISNNGNEDDENNVTTPHATISSNSSSDNVLAQLLQNATSWKHRYHIIEMDATRMTLQMADLTNMKWYLSFVLSGVRGEGRSDFMPVRFQTSESNNSSQHLFVPGYPPLPIRIMESAPPSFLEKRVRQNLRGDRPFSKTQWLQISDFPPHFITRKSSDAEWLIVNENVIMVSHT